MWERYYNIPPEEKSIQDCFNHGADHKAYKWAPQVDPRWNEEQKTSYWKGYNYDNV